MRLALLPLLLLAAPAHAQRLDTRVDDVVQTGDQVSCRSHAYPTLRLRHRADGSDAIATYTLPGKTPGTRLEIDYVPARGRMFNTATRRLAFVIDRPATAWRQSAATVRIDGYPADATFMVSALPGGALEITADPFARDAFAESLSTTEQITLTLRDRAHAALATLDFDSAEVRDIPDLLSTLHHSCLGER